jgi:peroxiredoxin
MALHRFISNFRMDTTNSAPLTAGTVAPEFTLPGTAGGPVTLSHYRGNKNVLLAFFPAAGTLVCTSEMCAFGEDFDRFSAADVEVLGISMDSVEKLVQFRDAESLQVQLRSDVDGTVARQFGALWKSGTIANRAYFLIDKDGTVRWAHVEEHPGLRRENEEILEAIRSVMA